MFSETMGCRIVWETALDRPGVSYAYSFVDLRPEPEGDEVLKRTLDTLERVGFYHVSEYVSFFDGINLAHELSPILPPENRPVEEFERAVEWAYNDPVLTEKHPMVCNSMHASFGTPLLEYGYDVLESRFARLQALEDVWHCNQNQYAAYRRQYRVARNNAGRPLGETVECKIVRPKLHALNDRTPLTLIVMGVETADVVGADCETAPIDASEAKREGRVLYHVYHDTRQRLPSAIACITNPENVPEAVHADETGDFSGLAGSLCVANDRLILVLRNTSPDALQLQRLAWRAPIGWEVEAVPSRQETVPVNGRLELSARLRPRGDRLLRIGRGLFVAELDFRLGGRAGRLFLTAECDQEAVDQSYPLNGFEVLGPLGGDDFDIDAFTERIESDQCPTSWPSDDGDAAWPGDRARRLRTPRPAQSGVRAYVGHVGPSVAGVRVAVSRRLARAPSGRGNDKPRDKRRGVP